MCGSAQAFCPLSRRLSIPPRPQKAFGRIYRRPSNLEWHIILKYGANLVIISFPSLARRFLQTLCLNPSITQTRPHIPIPVPCVVALEPGLLERLDEMQHRSASDPKLPAHNPRFIPLTPLATK
jgi:hypothetical protein